jgi:hypothetical protein
VRTIRPSVRSMLSPNSGKSYGIAASYQQHGRSASSRA